jgi:hypothetical protein
MGCDPEDEIISDICSIKNGVSRKIIEEVHRLSTTKFNFNDYFHIISKNEGDELFSIIRSLLEINGKMQNWKNYQIKRQELKDLELNQEDKNDHDSSNPLPALHQSDVLDQETHQIDDSMTHHVNDNFNKQVNSNTVFVERSLYEEAGPINPGEYLGTHNDIEDGDDNFMKVTIPSTLDSKNLQFEQERFKYESIKRFLNNYEEDHLEKSNYVSLCKYTAKLIRILDKVETAGITLPSIFEMSSFNKKLAFRMFFINLDIWGSWSTNSNLNVKNIPLQCRKEAREKVEFARISIGRCIVLMKDEKGKLFEVIRSKANIVLNAFENLSKYLTERTKISTNIRSQISHLKTLKKQKSTMMSKDALNAIPMKFLDEETYENVDEKFESIDLRNSRLDDIESYEDNKFEEEKSGYQKFTTDLEKNPFKQKPNLINHSYLRTYEDPHPDLIGYLLCIKCGHNGNFSIFEKSLYDKHLIQAGFVNDNSL